MRSSLTGSSPGRSRQVLRWVGVLKGCMRLGAGLLILAASVRLQHAMHSMHVMWREHCLRSCLKLHCTGRKRARTMSVLANSTHWAPSARSLGVFTRVSYLSAM